MEFARDQLPVLLNALYELDQRSIAVTHPAEEIGELYWSTESLIDIHRAVTRRILSIVLSTSILRIELDDTTEGTVTVTTGAVSYESALDDIQRAYGSAVREELPNSAAYVKAVVASGLADIRNRQEVETTINRYGYQDLQEGHPPRYAGFDTNLLPWRMHDVLGIDPELYSDEKGRAPVNGYTLPAGVETELSISYRYGQTAMPAARLADAFGSEYARLAGQPTRTTEKHASACRSSAGTVKPAHTTSSPAIRVTRT